MSDTTGKGESSEPISRASPPQQEGAESVLKAGEDHDMEGCGEGAGEGGREKEKDSDDADIASNAATVGTPDLSLDAKFRIEILLMMLYLLNLVWWIGRRYAEQSLDLPILRQRPPFPNAYIPHGFPSSSRRPTGAREETVGEEETTAEEWETDELSD
ncbi:hypothetical protein DACRYDRAFT_22424 [Dacryopinax primogenitus]|uniref:Uncharacterized protein n=1 Tax=Dacryopinax primogenitus (strain DJM 731) TaxID=1858805 RepID=M5G841_DACPD|nr:uncharacterized protein DACRYDRAFT_22424 [Dacryopinax primogenitus]EJU02037.1 hypothetical protein DACRYDRAFT_22424 [Dacryopinax primogenitus]